MWAPCVLVSLALVVRGLSRLGQTGGRRDLIGLYLCCDWSIPSPELGPGTPADVVTQGETCW